MAYELKQADIYSFAGFLAAETKQKGNELFFKYCPYCGGGHSKDKDTFSINLETGAFKCFRSSCGKQGHFVQAARDFGFKLDFDKSSIVYKPMPQKQIQTTSPAVEYLKSRGITENICRKYKITTAENKPSILVIPFYDTNGTLIMAKYRNTKFVKGQSSGGKEWCTKETKPILFGMQYAQNYEKPLVITEGQMDALALAECGVDNPVSVPTGAKGFTWVEHCYDYVDKFTEIIIFGDCENGEITLLKEMTSHFAHKIIKCVRQADYLMEKDANDILQKYGKDAVKQAVEKAEQVQTCRLKELADVKNVDIYSMERLFTGFPTLDKVLGGLYYGQVIVLTGKNGNGKSTVMSQIIASAISQRVKIMVYSGELPDYHFKRWLDLQIAGDDYAVAKTTSTGGTAYSLSTKDVEQISNYYKGTIWIYDNTAVSDTGNECDELVKTIELSIKKFGVRFVCLDNLMTALDVPLGEDLYRAQSSFLKRLKQVAQKYDVVILLVAHPRKSSHQQLEKDDIAGSGDITNRVDVVLTYTRDETKDELGYLAVKKNRLTGFLTKSDSPIELIYSPKSKRIIENGAKPPRYSWLKPYNDRVTPDENGDLPF